MAEFLSKHSLRTSLIPISTKFKRPSSHSFLEISVHTNGMHIFPVRYEYIFRWYNIMAPFYPTPLEYFLNAFYVY